MNFPNKCTLATAYHPDPGRLLNELYSQPGLTKKATKIALNLGIQPQDTSDVLHDALLILHRNFTEDRYQERSCLSTYFLAIVKWHALSKARRQRKYRWESLDGIAGRASLPVSDQSEELIRAEKAHLLDRALRQLGGHRRQILECWHSGYSMQEIADITGLKNDKVAKKEAWVGRKELRDFVLASPFYTEELA
jgi:RNA polymerase sigma factor (sigma-70 family)